MNFSTQITDIFHQAKANQWPFIQTYQKLKSCGVISYTVSWKNGYHAIFKFANTSIKENHIEGYKQPDICCMFSQNHAKKALLAHQQGKTSYLDWLYEMADAGVCEYIVNMQENTVTYYSVERVDSFVENIPVY